LAAGTGLKQTLDRSNGQAIPTELKLGPAPVTDKLKEQVMKNLQDEEEAAAAATNGDRPPADGEAPVSNGHDANGDVEMGSPKDQASRAQTRERSPTVQAVKLEMDIEKDTDLVSPTENETLPPVPGIFRIADLKREVEAVRDRRKMIRLGTTDDGHASSPVLPSVLAMTVFDGGERCVPHDGPDAIPESANISRATSVEFSPDSSLMAVGSAQSSIRLWSLKGEKLKSKSLSELSLRSSSELC
jgi:transcription initiation factor TFIID subunit 5